MKTHSGNNFRSNFDSVALQYLQQLNGQLDDVVTLMGGNTLTSNDRKKLDTILTIDVHIRDIIESFVRDSIMDAIEFEWESQLRYDTCFQLTQNFDMLYIFSFHKSTDFTGYTTWTICG